MIKTTDWNKRSTFSKGVPRTIFRVPFLYAGYLIISVNTHPSTVRIAL